MKHGESSTLEYIAWQKMRDRCLNAAGRDWRYYGGRGITICRRWDLFVKFLEDMGRKPSPQHSLDRIDNEGPYSPENCRWATKSQQSNNSRHNVRLTIYGETKNQHAWSVDARCLVSSQAFVARVERGWPPAAALTYPKFSKRPRRMAS